MTNANDKHDVYDCDLKARASQSEKIIIPIPKTFFDYYSSVVQIAITVKRYAKENKCNDMTSSEYIFSNDKHLQKLGLISEPEEDKETIKYFNDLQPMSYRSFDRLLKFETINEDYILAVQNNPVFQEIGRQLAEKEEFLTQFVPTLNKVIKCYIKENFHLEKNGLQRILTHQHRQRLGLPNHLSKNELQAIKNGTRVDISLMREMQANQYFQQLVGKYEATTIDLEVDKIVLNRSRKITYSVIVKFKKKSKQKSEVVIFGMFSVG